MAETEQFYWIWSNVHGGWRMAREKGYTTQLHEAGRYVEHIAIQLVKAGNTGQSRVEYPSLVMVAVNDAFLTPQAQEIMAMYRNEGNDVKVLNAAYFRDQDEALIRSLGDKEALNESLAQAANNQGRVVAQRPAESTKE